VFVESLVGYLSLEEIRRMILDLVKAGSISPRRRFWEPDKYRRTSGPFDDCQVLESSTLPWATDPVFL
jgi:hypothetical protein